MSTLELHVYDTCHLHENKKERYVHTTYRLYELKFKRLYVGVTYHLHESNNMNIKVSMFVEFSVYLLEGPGMSFASRRACSQASRTCCDSEGGKVFQIINKSKDISQEGVHLLSSLKLSQNFHFFSMIWRSHHLARLIDSHGSAVSVVNTWATIDRMGCPSSLFRAWARVNFSRESDLESDHLHCQVTVIVAPWFLTVFSD